ncbi:glycyl-radical enzyme activating protein [Sporolactobacillus sp. CQH2019]|uniref:glycyl-radical enzyme activating protein n=1 Tax=Sporolactobacillus sp. CQH2019 TaxID=3023512 RepID=UPI002368E96F|nr:glycyl-radical enzyme activating protein [Sporolactobacillus sp. CQH2019]MDD9147989.1 glycyl-radical enzyme activating protein [Sporolactobacillus sp. CQH2019]
MSNLMKGCVFNIQRFSIHDGPGIRTSVFFKGCPLRCSWCANPESQNLHPEKMWDNSKNSYFTTGEYLTIAEIMVPILKDVDYYHESGGGVTVTGGEVLLQTPFVVNLLRECKKNNISTACETSAYASLPLFKKLLGNVDLLIMDLKHYDSEKHRSEIGVGNKIIIQNLDYAISQFKNMILRIPIIPGFNDSVNDARHFSLFLREHKVDAVELLPFHQFGKNKYKFLNRQYKYKNVKALHPDNLIAFRDIVKSMGIECNIG